MCGAGTLANRLLTRYEVYTVAECLTQCMLECKYLRCGVGDAPVADRRRQREGRLGQVLRAVVTYR